MTGMLKLSDWGFKITMIGTSLAIQWLGLHASTAGGVGWIPGWGTNVPASHVARPKKKKKKTMINMLRALVEKLDNMQEQMGNINTEMGILRKYKKEMHKIKSTVTEVNAFMGSLVDCTQLSKESVSLRICQ